MRALATATLLLLAALGAGCDSSDDDDGVDGGGTTDGGTMTDGGDTGGNAGGGIGGGGDGTFAEIFGRGPTDEPVDFDAAALSADLETLFGTASDESTDVTEGDDVDDMDARRRRAGR